MELDEVCKDQNALLKFPHFVTPPSPPSATDPVKPDPVDFFASAGENLASPVHGEILNFTRPVCGLPGATLTNPAYIICVCLKKAKQRPDRKGQPSEKNLPTR